MGKCLFVKSASDDHIVQCNRIAHDHLSGELGHKFVAVANHPLCESGKHQMPEYCAGFDQVLAFICDICQQGVVA